MIDIYKYNKNIDIPCFVCGAPANFDIHITSQNGGFTNINLCENCLNQLKTEFSAFKIPDKIKL